MHGMCISLTRGKEIKQTWKLPIWPSDHAGMLTTTLTQGTNSIKVSFELDGVLTGMQDEIQRNLDGY